jgi:hypothetical protein
MKIRTNRVPPTKPKREARTPIYCRSGGYVVIRRIPERQLPSAFLGYL